MDASRYYVVQRYMSERLAGAATKYRADHVRTMLKGLEKISKAKLKNKAIKQKYVISSKQPKLRCDGVTLQIFPAKIHVPIKRQTLKFHKVA